jgi:hypothetical protein
MPILINAYKLLLSLMILLCSMLTWMKMQWQIFGTTSIRFLIKSRKWFSKKIGCCGFQSMHSATICYAEPSLAKLDGLIFETRGSEVSRNSDESSEMTAADPDDWRTPSVCYLENLGHIHDRKVWWRDLKYVMLDNTIYR